MDASNHAEVRGQAQQPEDQWSITDVKDLHKFVVKVKASEPIPVFWPSPVKQVVVAAFDSSVAKERRRQDSSQRSLLAVPRKNQQSVIRSVIGSTLAAECAALARALGRQLYVRLLLESLLFREPEGGTDWPSRLRILGILVTDATSL